VRTPHGPALTRCPITCAAPSTWRGSTNRKAKNETDPHMYREQTSVGGWQTVDVWSGMARICKLLHKRAEIVASSPGNGLKYKRV
jgi:hypothetical protein